MSPALLSVPGLMYACGDSREPYQESVDLVEQLALDYLMRMVHKASAASITNKIGYDDVLMILRQVSVGWNAPIFLLS